MRYRDGRIEPMRHPERQYETALAAHYASLPDTVTVSRQFHFDNGCIADLVVESAVWQPDGDWYTITTIIEIKAQRAGRSALAQVDRYRRAMRQLFARWGVDWELRVALAAPSFSREIEDYAAASAESDGLLSLIRLGQAS